MRNRVQVLIDGNYGDNKGSVHIKDQNGEVIMWDNQEWIDDPSLVYVIVNTVIEALTKGTDFIRERIKHESGYDGEECGDDCGW